MKKYYKTKANSPKLTTLGFTLIELIAVLVIMAIIALIVTPLVMSIIRKARVSADKRSIDAYGRSIELAIAGYLLDTGKFPTSVEQLTIEYSGNKVECSTTQINTDSSIYLAGCKVAGRSVEGYTYGKEEVITYDSYKVGDEVTYNNVNYYVLKDSGAKESTVTMLKADPLTVDEVNLYGEGHVNKNINESTGTAYNQNGYGGMAYYSSSTCSNYPPGGCKNDYESSEIKYVIDAWSADKASSAIEARLISKNEIETEQKEYDPCGGCGAMFTGDFVKNDWMYNNNYWYWTNTPKDDTSTDVWTVNSNSLVNNNYVFAMGVVRPVIVLPKSAL